MDDDELWALYSALHATCESITTSDEGTQLIMDLQEEALELVTSLVQQRPGLPPVPAS